MVQISRIKLFSFVVLSFVFSANSFAGEGFYEIDDFKVIIIGFLLSYLTVRVLKSVLTRHEKQNTPNVTKIRGGVLVLSVCQMNN